MPPMLWLSSLPAGAWAFLFRRELSVFAHSARYAQLRAIGGRECHPRLRIRYERRAHGPAILLTASVRKGSGGPCKMTNGPERASGGRRA
jgi:hypothetical protein